MVNGVMNPALRELQTAFKRHLMERDSAIAEHIAVTGDLDVDTRLAIYGNAYYARLIESLEQDYEAIHVLLGDDDFTELCQRYIETYPSKFYSLRWFGQYMSEFLAGHEPYDKHPYLRELAVFEWTFIEAFDAADAPIASETDAAQVPPDKWPGLKIILHPSVHWFEYEWNILPVWKAATSEELSMPELVSLPQKAHCVVWRQELMTQYRTMENEELIMLCGARENKCFAELCESLTQFDIDPEQVPVRAATILKTWLAAGMITELGFG